MGRAAVWWCRISVVLMLLVANEVQFLSLAPLLACDVMVRALLVLLNQNTPPAKLLPPSESSFPNQHHPSAKLHKPPFSPQEPSDPLL
jgi:hypothetical protein